MSQILVGDDLHKSFGLTQALRGASIVLDEGEIVAVMGPSGSGKSTLLHCLAGMLTPDRGEVHFAGRRIDELPDRERAHLRRTELGFVFQFGQLVPELPAVENIALPLLLAGRRRKQALAAAAPWLSRLGLDGLGERLPGELSGGQGQRVAMARALVVNPTVGVRRRAHGLARLPSGRRGHGAARRRRSRAGHQRPDGDARAEGRRVRGSDGAGPRWRRRPRAGDGDGGAVTFRLGLRLAVAGGRESLLRLAVTAFGVAVGVVLLLLCLTGQSAEQGRAERSGWQSADPDTPATAPDPALFLTVTDYHDGTAMIRGYVAALGPRPPVPPGLERLPGPGEVAVSPAMRRLLVSTPDDELDDRYPGRVIATIGDEGLAHPDQLVALIGRTPDQLGEVTSRSLHRVRGFGSLPSGYAFYQGIRVLLLLGAVLLLLPVIIFIVMATRVAAAHREQRLAAIRLVGATRLQAAVVAAVETGLGAVAGTVLGWAGYEAGRRILAATLTFQGARFFVDDVVVAPWLLALVLAGVPLLAMLTTVVALGRVQAGPLATSRHGRRPPPSARRALPLAAGIGGLLAAAPLRRVADSETR